jgi:hypothetical protein
MEYAIPKNIWDEIWEIESQMQTPNTKAGEITEEIMGKIRDLLHKAADLKPDPNNRAWLYNRVWSAIFDTLTKEGL